MPPKQRITKNMILDGAFAVFRRDGMASVNARSVAREIGCSTQPIFSYYSGMKELKGDIEEQAYGLFAERVQPALKSDHTLLACAQAYIDFAKDEPSLFCHLFILTGRGVHALDSDQIVPRQLFAETAKAYSLDEEKAKTLCLTVCAYAHGMAAVLATGAFSLDAEEAKKKIGQLLERELRALR